MFINASLPKIYYLMKLIGDWEMKKHLLDTTYIILDARR